VDALLVFKDGIFQSRHELGPQETIIGRAGTIAIGGAGVSRRHCAFRRRDGDVVLVDLGSSYGTLLQGQKIPPVTELKVRNGDEVAIPAIALRVLLGLSEAQISAEVELARTGKAPPRSSPPADRTGSAVVNPPRPGSAPSAPAKPEPRPAPAEVLPPKPANEGPPARHGGARKTTPLATPGEFAVPKTIKGNLPVDGHKSADGRGVIPNEVAALVLAKATPPEAFGYLPPGAEPLSIEQWLLFELFEDVPADAVKKFLGRTIEQDQYSIWVRRFKKGEIICREGDYGSTAFYILRGRVSVLIQSARKTPLVSTTKRVFAKVKTALRLKSDLAARKRPSIAVEGALNLDLGDPIASMGDGEIFGEMTCMSLYPRSATVIAEEDTVCFEMLRNVLVDLLYKRSKAFKEKLDAAYRERALTHQLRNVSIFRDLPKEAIDELKNKVELVGPLDPGDVIFKEGDPPDALYVIRIGFVRVAQSFPGGELVLAYLGLGQCVGEVGLLEGKPHATTCTALDRVELVKIAKADFEKICRQSPNIRSGLAALASERKEAAGRVAREAPSVPLGQFLDQGLMNASNALLIDLERCTRCDECVKACADTHDGVTRLTRDGLRFDKYLVTTSCRACTDPVCMIGCPVSSIRRRESLEIVIEDWCIGCGLCAQQCPYGNITIHELAAEKAPRKSGRPLEVVKDAKEHGKDVIRKAATCDLCADLVGPGGTPSCVYACPHGAALRVEPRSFFGLNRSR